MSKYVLNHVLPCLTERPGEIVYVKEIAEDTGLNPRQVAVAISNARRTHESLAREIEVIIAANAWRYRPTAVAASNGHVTTRDTEVNAASTPRRAVTSSADAPVDAPTRDITPTVDPATRGHRLFEEVHTTRDGKTIVRDEQGSLYYLEEL